MRTRSIPVVLLVINMYQHYVWQMTTSISEADLITVRLIRGKIMIMNLIRIIDFVRHVVDEYKEETRFLSVYRQEYCILLSHHKVVGSDERVLIEDAILWTLLRGYLNIFGVSFMILEESVVSRLDTFFSFPIWIREDLHIKKQRYELSIVWLPFLEHEKIAVTSQKNVALHLQNSKKQRSWISVRMYVQEGVENVTFQRRISDQERIWLAKQHSWRKNSYDP